LRETVPNLLDELESLGGWELENLIAKASVTHGWKVRADAARGKTWGRSFRNGLSRRVSVADAIISTHRANSALACTIAMFSEL